MVSWWEFTTEILLVTHSNIRGYVYLFLLPNCKLKKLKILKSNAKVLNAY